MEKDYFLLDNAHRISHIPMRYINPSLETVLLRCGCTMQSDPVGLNEDLRHKLMGKAVCGQPIIDFEQDEIVYGAFLVDNGNCVILGPVCIGQQDDVLCSAFVEQFGLEKDYRLCYKNYSSFCSMLFFLYHSFSGKIIREADIAMPTQASNIRSQEQDHILQSYMFNKVELEKSRYSYVEEISIMEKITEGDIDGIRKLSEAGNAQLIEERVGKLASKPFKNFEYAICVSIALSARAAINGGLEANLAYSMADIFLQRLEGCQNIASIINLQREVMLTFAENVRELNEQRTQHSYIEKCKAYIDNHLNQKFTIDDIACEIGINRSYLSRRFSQEVGVGITQYTQQKRVAAAKNMLKFSDESLSNIAVYLCFNSQSHFGAIFKKLVGMTPQKFRSKELLVDYD